MPSQSELKKQVENIRFSIEIGKTVTPDHLQCLAVLCKEAYNPQTELEPCEGYDRAYWTNVSRFVRVNAEDFLFKTNEMEFAELSDDMLLWEAPQLFESYLLYMEKDREPRKRFYWPRRGTLKTVVDDLQDLEDGVITFYGLSLPARVGKTSTCIFFLTWHMGRKPNSHNAMGGHSNALVKGFYKEVMNIINSPEYHFHEVFPKAEFESKSAEDFTINLDRPDRFATLTCRGIDSTWTGAVDVSHDGYLYVDDLVKDREESLSAQRLNDKYQTYLNVMVDRKNDGAKELMVGTRWNLYDPLGRCEQRYKDNPKARFRKIPALDDNDESNFKYECGLGFSTQYYKDLRATLDSNEWQAKYQQKPFVREGLLFPEENIKTFNGFTPQDSYRTIAFCDVAFGGGDSLSMPIAEVHESGIFIVDWVFSNHDKYMTRPLVAGALMRNHVGMAQFESNAGGSEYAEEVGKLIQLEQGHINITTKRADNQHSKGDRITQYSSDILKNMYFLDKKKRSADYQRAMDELTTYVAIGKNLHDDSPDSLVGLYKLATGGNKSRIEVFRNPFWW